MGRFAAGDVLLLSFDDQLRYFDQALTITVGSVTGPTTQNEERRDVLSFLSSVAATPVGAEIAIYRCNIFKSSNDDPILAEVKLLTTLSILLESLSTFPLNSPKKPASQQDIWIQNQSQNWHNAAKKTKAAFEAIVQDILVDPPKSDIAKFIQKSQPLLRKVPQVFAELLLWFPPSEWPATFSVFRETLNRSSKPNDSPEVFLRPSVFFVTILGETLFQISANPGFTDRASARSAWEMGRLTANSRNNLVQQIGDWVDLAWAGVAQDFVYCYNRQIPPGTASLNSHIAAFAETVQLHVAVAKATGQTKGLAQADWKFFMSPYVLKSSQCRVVCEALSDCVANLHATKRIKKSTTGLRPGTLAPAKHRELILSTISVIETLTMRNHPGITGDSDCDGDDIYAMVRVCTALTMLMTTEGSGEFVSRVTLIASMLMSHPATLIATHALNLWETVMVHCKEKELIRATLDVIWLRCLRCGDPAVREAAGQDPLKWLNSAIVSVIQRLMGTMNGAVSWQSNMNWSDLTEMCALAEDENFAQETTSTTENPILPNFAGFRTTLKRIVESFTDAEPALLSLVGESGLQIIQELLVNPQFLESTHMNYFPVAPLQLKTVSGRIKGFLSPAYTALDLMCFIVEVCNTRSELKEYVRQMLSQIARANISVIDTHAELVKAPDMHCILRGDLGTHGHMLEYRRVDLVGQVCATAVPLVMEMSEMLIKRLVITPEKLVQPQTLEDEYFYMLRNKARESVTSLWAQAMSTDRVTFSQMGPLVELFGRRAHDLTLTEDERSGFSRSVLSLAASTGDFQTGREAFNAVGGQLLQGVLRDFHTRGISPENLRAYLLDGPEDAASQRRRVLLRELQTCEDVFEKLSLPQLCGGMFKGRFLSEKTGPPTPSTLPSLGSSSTILDSALLSVMECEEFKWSFKSVLTDFVESLMPILASICSSFIGLWQLPEMSVIREQLNDSDIEELMKPNGRFASSVSLRHMVHMRIIFRVLGSTVKLLMSQRLYSGDDCRSTLEALVAMISGPTLKSVPIVYKDAMISSALFGGVLHAFNPWRLPTTPTEIPPVMVDGSCFFFPSRESASFHLDILESTIPGLSNCLADLLNEWDDAKRIRDMIVANNQQEDPVVDRLQYKLAQLVRYATSTCHGFHCLFNITKRGAAGSSAEIILQPQRTLGSLRSVLHRIIKRNLFLRPTLCQSLLQLTLELAKVPHPSVSLIMHQVLRAYFIHAYSQISFVMQNEPNQLTQDFIRNLLTQFTATADTVFVAVIKKSFQPIDDHDPYFLQEIPNADQNRPYGRLATYYSLGGPSESPNRTYLSLPTTVNRHTNLNTIATRADLPEKSFCNDQVITLHEIARNAVLAFTLRCNVLVYRRPANTDIQDDILTQIENDPHLRKILGTVANDQTFAFVFQEEQLLSWIRNMCNNRSNHDARLARDELKYFLLENILKTNEF